MVRHVPSRTLVSAIHSFPWGVGVKDANDCSYIPFTHILSPRCASVRISSQSDIVNDVPPPPLAVVSRGSSDVTARTRLAL